MTVTATYFTAIRIVDDFTEGMSGGSSEYERGQLELLADLFGYRGASDMDERKEQIKDDIRKLKADRWADR